MKSEFYNKVIHDLSEYGFKNVVPENVGFFVDNDNDIVIVDYKFMSTGLHYNKKDLNVDEIIEAGFKYYQTWNC